MLEIYQISFAALMERPWGQLLVFLPLGLLFTVSFSYFDIKFAKYSFLHALYFTLIAYAVVWTPLAMVGIINVLAPNILYHEYTPQTYNIVSAVIIWICTIVVYLSPVAGLFVVYFAVRRTLECTPQQALQFMYRWLIANLLLVVLLAISIPNYVIV